MRQDLRCQNVPEAFAVWPKHNSCCSNRKPVFNSERSSQSQTAPLYVRPQYSKMQSCSVPTGHSMEKENISESRKVLFFSGFYAKNMVV